ncbi:hypothetical protein NESM_000696100 [Novymonas esmeraldas]|uniref:Uncharacterized protein n=1 Tax=Novymonas esmeraldas TaxID=1808958 RepID=A0AAW0EVB8_9TRYP
MASSPPSSSASLPRRICVLGTLPDLLQHAVTQPGSSAGVAAYLTVDPPPAPLPRRATAEGMVVHSGSASTFAVPRYAVFDDAGRCCRWTVELTLIGVPAGGGVSDSPCDTWKAAMPHIPAAEEVVCAPLSERQALRLYMKPDTWRQTALLREDAAPRSAASDPAATAAPDVQGRLDAAPAAERPPSTASSAEASTLLGLSLDQLVEQHTALVRRLVQVLAPQRCATAHVVRELCTSMPATAASSGSAGRHRTLALPSAGTGATMHYTDTDVAAAVELLTSPNARQPRLRELKSDGYLLMSLDEFTDGETRHRAANRAYPALALHWPASEQRMDAMERYADRDVVLETRKRHPELVRGRGEGEQPRKRARASSSDASDAEKRENDEEAPRQRPPEVAAAASKLSSLPPPPSASAPPATPRSQFHSLREYPQSLEHGDLQTWARSEEARHAHKSFQEAASTAPLTSLLLAGEQDVAVLRLQYNALTAAESNLERRLRAYGDTIQELRSWYRGELCTPKFRAELSAWLRTQEESRSELARLHTEVHVVRYRLQRDLSDYLHLHALGVL